MNLTQTIVDEVQSLGSPEKAKHLSRFFKCGTGEYGEGDLFYGVTVPEQRKIAAKYQKIISPEEIEPLLLHAVHEVRLTGVILLVKLFGRKGMGEEAVKLYQKQLNRINNWDLVDLSAPYITGPWYFDKDRLWLFEILEHESLWYRRIAVMSTFYFIRQKDFRDTFIMAEKLLGHPHDLIHKACGWMIREIANRDFEAGFSFVKKYHDRMPRTMLRYAIEKYPEVLRLQILKGQI